MSAVVVSLEVNAAGMRASLASVHAALPLLSEATKRVFGDLLAFGIEPDERFDLVVAKPVDRAASIAGKAHIFELLPSDRYLELVAAIADECDAGPIDFSHGWPLLSVVSAFATVAEAGGVTTAPGGGASPTAADRCDLPFGAAPQQARVIATYSVPAEQLRTLPHSVDPGRGRIVAGSVTTAAGRGAA